jgi:hypothetical protein
MASILPKITIKGLDGVIANIDALNANLLVRIQDIIQAEGEVIAQQAGANLPAAINGKVRGVKTGKLKRSIKSKFDAKNITAKIAPWKGGRPHPLGHIVEFGTDPHPVKGGGQHPGTPAIPFLFPAFENEKNRLVERIKDAIRGLA